MLSSHGVVHAERPVLLDLTASVRIAPRRHRNDDGCGGGGGALPRPGPTSPRALDTFPPEISE
eukprot:14290777-Alexandrium_andersonii.AAC.1